MLFAFVVKPAMTIALEIRVSYLISEFLAHADIIRCFFKPAGTVAFLLFQTFSYYIYNLFIIIKFNLHVCFLFFCVYAIFLSYKENFLCIFTFSSLQRKSLRHLLHFFFVFDIFLPYEEIFLCITAFSSLQRKSLWRFFCVILTQINI